MESLQKLLVEEQVKTCYETKRFCWTIIGEHFSQRFILMVKITFYYLRYHINENENITI